MSHTSTKYAETYILPSIAFITKNHPRNKNEVRNLINLSLSLVDFNHVNNKYNGRNMNIAQIARPNPPPSSPGDAGVPNIKNITSWGMKTAATNAINAEIILACFSCFTNPRSTNPRSPIELIHVGTLEMIKYSIMKMINLIMISPYKKNDWITVS